MKIKEIVSESASEGLGEGKWAKRIGAAALATGLGLGHQVYKDPEALVKLAMRAQYHSNKPWAALNTELDRANIHGHERAQFFGQIAVETGKYKWSIENRSKESAEKEYGYNTEKGKGLGNIYPGDGWKYKGRGFIQLTGRENYRRAGKVLGLPLEEQPELAESPAIAAQIAVRYYWKYRVAPKVKDWTQTDQVTRQINPGMKHRKERELEYQKALERERAGTGEYQGRKPRPVTDVTKPEDL